MYLSFIAISNAHEHEKKLEVSETKLKFTGIGFCYVVSNIEEERRKREVIDTKGECFHSFKSSILMT